MRTILGSCVGVALYDPYLKIGGMCHYLLSTGNGQHSTKYGDVAISTLIHRFSKAGSPFSHIQAFVAGGALLLDQHEIFFVGENNIKIALELLNEYKIPIIEQQVGGDRGRRMSLNTDTGQVKIEFIPQVEIPKSGIF
jgi:chemotaxis protein CheD